MKKKIESQSYTLYDKTGAWLGQVVLTSDGMFASVTDWGNFSFAWRAFGDDFKEFMAHINVSYFGTKMFTGMSYVAHPKQVEKACYKFAEKILPPLQKILIKEKEGITIIPKSFIV